MPEPGVPEPGLPEPWMRGVVPGIHPVTGHLLRAIEQIREDSESALTGVTAEATWAKPHGITSAGFHAKHLAGSTTRLSTYLEGNQLTESQLAEIPNEANGTESPAELLASINNALDRYKDLITRLQPEDFGSSREIGRKRYQTTAISVAIHVVEHAQRHIGGMIAARKTGFSRS